MKIFEVGGCVRDSLLGIPAKDIDFAVEAQSFEAMNQEMKARGFKVFQESSQFLTIRAKFPNSNLVADFVLCRFESGFSNSRHPDVVKPGTIFDDLARRDFTVNAIARCQESGQLIDPHGGVKDLEAGILRAVGNAETRFAEDALRVLRALRFSISHQLKIDEEIWSAFQLVCPSSLAGVSTERKREELNKMFKANSLLSMRLIAKLPEDLQEAIFEDASLWLKATLEKSGN